MSFPGRKLGPRVTWYLVKTTVMEIKPPSDLPPEILLCILLARLEIVSIHVKGEGDRLRRPTFAGFPTFCPMTFHLLASYSLMAASRAAL